MLKLDCRDFRVLVIPDLHMPFEHQDAIPFLAAIKEKYLKDKKYIVLSLGDEIDAHNLSFHDNEQGMPSASDELKEAKRHIRKLREVFQRMYVLESNHGSLIFRRAKHHGLPLEYFRNYHEVLETPNWSWHSEILIKTKLGLVYFTHGKSSSPGKMVKEMGCSTVQGHYHTKFQVTWYETALESRFCVYSGCLVDRSHLAFSYARANIPLFILGATMISSSGYPELIKMELDSSNRWTGSLP